MVSKAELYQEIVNEEIRKVTEAAVRRHKDEMEQHCREIEASGSQEAGARIGNAYLTGIINSLRSILSDGLKTPCRPDFHILRSSVPPLEPPERLQGLRKPNVEISQLQAAHAQNLKYRRELLEDWERGYQAGERGAVAAFCSLTLGLSPYRAGFTTNQWHLSFDPTSGELSVDYKLPSPTVVPAIAEYKYVKTSRTVEQWPRKETEIRALYLEAIAAITLRSLYEVFWADTVGHVQHIVFKGFVTTTIATVTDKEIRTLIAVRVKRGRFSELNLTRIEPLACLRWLGVAITQHPALAPKRR